MKTKFFEIIKGALAPFINVSFAIRDKVKKSIRFELILIFAMCLFISMIIGGISIRVIEGKSTHTKGDYIQSKIEYDHDRNIDSRLLSVGIALSSFLIIFYLITNKKMKYIEIVSIGLLEISKGNLDYRIKKYGKDELSILADNINYMAEELKTKIENERKAEKTKNDLITNVSHDLRTPLTSIKGYLELIKNKKYTQENQLDQYANISFNQAEKLELLINDLFEYTKLANNAVKFDKQDIALNELLDQLIEELVPICENTDVIILKEFIKEKAIVNVDPNKVARVFENLLINAIRYSLKPSNIRVILSVENGFSLVSIQNKCEKISDDNLSKIFDRFYRVEESRSSDTGGSGLGLAIAKSMVELQQGFIEAKYKDGYISFNVKFKIVIEKS